MGFLKYRFEDFYFCNARQMHLFCRSSKLTVNLHECFCRLYDPLVHLSVRLLSLSVNIHFAFSQSYKGVVRTIHLRQKQTRTTTSRSLHRYAP